jgi:hypothetical protein
MYTRHLIPTANESIPLLIVTSTPGPMLPALLHARGWKPYGTTPVEDPGTGLRISPDGVSLSYKGHVLLHDAQGDPIAPPGWWDSVTQMRDRILIAVVHHETHLLQSHWQASHHKLLSAHEAALAVLTSEPPYI